MNIFPLRDMPFANATDRQRCAEDCLLDTASWAVEKVGEEIARGTFRSVREAVLRHLDTNTEHQVLVKCPGSETTQGFSNSSVVVEGMHDIAVRFSSYDASKWWVLREWGMPVPPFFRFDPASGALFLSDLRKGLDGQQEALVFDTNAETDPLLAFFRERPLRNAEELVAQIEALFADAPSFLSLGSTECFLMVMDVHDGIMQVLFGDMKMAPFLGPDELPEPRRKDLAQSKLFAFLQEVTGASFPV